VGRLVAKKEHDHTTVGWRAWFDNGDVYCSRDTDWKDIPDDGVQYVMDYDAELSSDGNYRGILSGYDYYWITPESGFEVFGGHEHPGDRYPGAIIKRGKWMPSVKFEDLRRKVVESTCF